MPNQPSRMNGGRLNITHDRVRGILHPSQVEWLILIWRLDELRDQANAPVAYRNVAIVAVGLKLGVYLLQFTPRTHHAPSTVKSVADSVSRTWTCTFASEGYIEDL